MLIMRIVTAEILWRIWPSGIVDQESRPFPSALSLQDPVGIILAKVTPGSVPGKGKGSMSKHTVELTLITQTGDTSRRIDAYLKHEFYPGSER